MYAEPFRRSSDSGQATPAASRLSFSIVTTLSTRWLTGSTASDPSISTNGGRGTPKVKKLRSLIFVRNAAPGTRNSL